MCVARAPVTHEGDIVSKHDNATMRGFRKCGHSIRILARCRQQNKFDKSAKQRQVKRPRGRPQLGAILAQDGSYYLLEEAIEAAAERVIRHRTACRERYVATRSGLRVAKPELFLNQKKHPTKQLGDQNLGSLEKYTDKTNNDTFTENERQ